MLKALLYAYAPGRRKIKVPVLAGRNDPDRASFRLRSGGMTDRKGVDSIGRGRGSDGKRAGQSCGGSGGAAARKIPSELRELKNSGEEPISQTDPESRPLRRGTDS